MLTLPFPALALNYLGGDPAARPTWHFTSPNAYPPTITYAARCSPRLTRPRPHPNPNPYGPICSTNLSYPNSTPNRRLIRRGLGIAGRGRGTRLCLLAFEASCLAQRSRQLAGVYWSLPRPLSWCADPTATLRLPSPFWSARHVVSSLTADLMPYVAENNFTG